jgi:DnaA family protein
MQQLTLDIAPLPQPSLRNFVTGANAQLLSALHAALDGSGNERRLCLWGGPGSGKTYLLTACASASGGHFHACGKSAAGDFSGYDDAGLLALDDVDRLDAQGQIALFNLINRRDSQTGSGMLMVSCSQPPTATALRADLATRLAQSLVLEVSALSDTDKAAALSQHATQRGIQLTDDVTRYLLTHLSRDLRVLIAVLDALDKISLQTHRAITVPLLREVLQAPLDLGSGSGGNN